MLALEGGVERLNAELVAGEDLAWGGRQGGCPRVRLVLGHTGGGETPFM